MFIFCDLTTIMIRFLLKWISVVFAYEYTPDDFARLSKDQKMQLLEQGRQEFSSKLLNFNDSVIKVVRGEENKMAGLKPKKEKKKDDE